MIIVCSLIGCATTPTPPPEVSLKDWERAERAAGRVHHWLNNPEVERQGSAKAPVSSSPQAPVPTAPPKSPAPAAPQPPPSPAYEAAISRADQLVNQGQFLEALSVAQEAIRLDARPFTAYYYAAFALVKRDLPQEAERYAKDALNRTTGHSYMRE